MQTALLGTILLLAPALFSPALNAQKSVAVAELQPLASGVTLPVRLGRSLQAGKVKPGTGIVVTTTQRVPVGAGFYLHHGAKLRGAVVASVKGDGTSAQPSVLSLRFTSLEYRGRTVPIATRAIAIANFVQVDETAVPTMGVADRGNSSPASWTTLQVGGDVLARDGWIGELCDSTLQPVGSADYYGVYTLPRRPPGGDGPAFPRALGVFSTTASGLYGMEEGTALQSPAGTITLTRPAGKLLLRDGDDLLLEVVSVGPQP